MSKPSKKKKGRWTKNDTELTVMALPTTIWYILFCFLPMFGLIIAFKNYKITGGKSFIYNLFHSDWAGFKNFSFLIRSNDLFVILRNTILYNLAFIALGMVFSVGLAIMISLLHNKRASKVYQTMMFFPYFMSWVVVASVFKMILDPNVTGVVNSLLLKANMINEPIYFLGDSKYWRGTFYVMNVWKDTGWGTILFLATLSGISPDLYEAAQIDGANRWKRLIYITLPALANTIITVFILNLAKVMNLFESVFVTMNNAVLDVAEVLQTYVYRKTFSSGNSDYGYTTAVGLFKSFVGMILVLSCNYASKKVRGRGIV